VAATSNHRSSNHRSFDPVEDLESRILCRAPRPAKIASAFLDNRGQAFFTVTVALDPTTLSRKTAALYSAGTDGVFGTADDARLYTKVGYRKGRLSLRSDALTLNDKYRVILNASVIKDVNGLALDGEFNGMPEISGDGTPGGNYDVVTTDALKTRVRFSTAAGYINVGLYRNTPNTKANFMHYVQEGAYDSTVFHRSIKASAGGIDIVQGGGFTINTAANTTGTIHNHGPINNEGTNLNTKGTIAMANAGANTATTQWFFNVNTNSGLDTTPGTYAVFGAVLDAESQTTLDALLALPTTGSSLAFPLAGQTTNTDVPIRSVQAVIDRSPDAAHGNYVFSPKDDLITVDRVAALFDVAATPGASRSLAAAAAAVTNNVPSAVPTPAPTAAGAVNASAFSALAIDRNHSVLDDTAE
jgi:cyclophilin family peptidyl-prolyl cis-trans isomerase